MLAAANSVDGHPAFGEYQGSPRVNGRSQIFAPMVANR